MTGPPASPRSGTHLVVMGSDPVEVPGGPLPPPRLAGENEPAVAKNEYRHVSVKWTVLPSKAVTIRPMS